MPIDKTLEQVVAEIRSSHLDATIETYFNVTAPIRYDSQRMSQMFSNLPGNAVAHGSPTDQSKFAPRLKIMNSNCRLSMRAIPFQTRH